MKIYIAGKISGLEWDEVVTKFSAVSAQLRRHGYTPLCPTEMFPENPVWDWAEYMLADLRIIWNHAEGLLMLPDWTDSKGATLEHLAAKTANKPIYYSLDELPKLD